MIESRLRIGGAMTYWEIHKSSDKEIIQDGLRDLGLSSFCPSDRSHNSCIRAALADVFEEPSKDDRYVVRPAECGFVVANEHPNDDVDAGDKWADVVAKVTINEDQSISLTPYDYSRLDEINQRVATAGKTYSSGAVSKSLISLVDHLGGCCMRSAGGVYWLLDHRLEDWREISAVFERAAPKDKTKIYAPRMVADDEMIRSVGDALQAEILADVNKIIKDISGEVTEAGCLRRLEQANRMLQKVRRYEQVFMSPLPALSTAIADLGGQIAMASLQAASV